MKWMQAGVWYNLIQQKKEPTKMLKVFFILLLLISILISVVLACVPNIIQILTERGKILGGETIQFGLMPYILPVLLLIGVITGIVMYYRRNYAASAVWIGGMMIPLWLGFISGIVPIIYEYQQGPLYRFSMECREKNPESYEIVDFGINRPTIIYYSQHSAIRLGRSEYEKLEDILRTNKPVYVFSKLKWKSEFEKLPSFHTLKTEGQYIIGSNLPQQ